MPVPDRYGRALFWLRRDLRDYDSAGLCHALKSSRKMFCAFIFDREILDELPSSADRRVEFIWESIDGLRTALEHLGGGLIVRHARSSEAIPRLAAELKVNAVFANDDYEPLAIARDRRVEHALSGAGIAFHRHKDTVIFEKDEVLTQAGRPYSVFTPYKNAWLKKLNAQGDFPVRRYPVETFASRLTRPTGRPAIPTLESLGFERANLRQLGIAPGMSGANSLLRDFYPRMAKYKEARDFPALKGVSYLSVHNRFGTVSIRELAAIALSEHNLGAETWLSELVWRDYYFQIFYHHPHAAASAFRPEYGALRWLNDAQLFKAWCEARTGYPIIDAAMRQLNQSGYMHNRLCMIAASCLTKDLHVDWRWGEKYFADNLNDFDLAANNGGWQWAALTGCDAQPWFRIFNPVTQSQRFNPEGAFIRRYVPELRDVPGRLVHAPWAMTALKQQESGCLIGKNYPAPLVDHATSREKTLQLFKAVKG